MIVSKRLNLPLLQQELAAASIVVPGLGTFVDTEGLTNLHTYDAEGRRLEMPVGSQPVVDAHVAPPWPYDYASTTEVRGQVRTTDDTPTEIYRYATEGERVCGATLSFLGINGTFDVFEASVRYVWKRGTGAAALVGEAPLTDIPEQASADWDVRLRVDGNDAVFEVIGERTAPVDWLVYGQITVFAPGGLA